jgi:hypothetical protein
MSLIELIEQHIIDACVPREKINTFWLSDKHSEQDYQEVRNTFKGVKIILSEGQRKDKTLIQYKNY